jgi:hypothetical protein
VEPGSQILRLSIPGSIFVLTGVGTYTFAQVLWGKTLSDVQSLTTLTTSVTAIAASIPIGFLVYQIYYWRYSPFFLRKYVTRDHGRDALSGLPPDILARLRTLFDARLDVRRHHESVNTQVRRRLRLLKLNDELMRARYKVENPQAGDEGDYSFEEDERFEKDERNIRRIYKDNWYENWDVFRSLLDLIATRGERPEIKRNFMNLYDIYHSLGAGRLAVPLGTSAAVLYLARAHHEDISHHLLASIVGLMVVVALTVLFAYVLHQTRITTWRSAISKVRLDLDSCFKTNAHLVELLPEEEDGFTPRRELRRESNARLRRYRRPFISRAARRPVMRLLGDVGTIEWSRRTGGLLSGVERMRFLIATALTIGSEIPRLLAARVIRAAAGPDPSEVQMPDTPFARAVIEACNELEPMMVEHCYRSYIFGRTLAKVEGAKCDEKALFAATMLHDQGFLNAVALDSECFTAASATSVQELLSSYGFSEQDQRDVLDAITRHLNPVVDPSQGEIQRYAHAGILLDMFGVRARELDPEGVERVFDEHPRHGFTVAVEGILREHGGKVKKSRSRLLFASGFGGSLALSRWRKLDRSS